MADGVAIYQLTKARSFANQNLFFDTYSKVVMALNRGRYTSVKEWAVKFKQRFLGNEQVKQGFI